MWSVDEFNFEECDAHMCEKLEGRGQTSGGGGEGGVEG